MAGASAPHANLARGDPDQVKVGSPEQVLESHALHVRPGRIGDQVKDVSLTVNQGVVPKCASLIEVEGLAVLCQKLELSAAGDLNIAIRQIGRLPVRQ